MTRMVPEVVVLAEDVLERAEPKISKLVASIDEARAADVLLDTIFDSAGWTSRAWALGAVLQAAISADEGNP